jgi:CheY-like chemotaxis protein
MDKPTVLVLEDEPLISLLMQTALDEAGFAVIAAADSDEAEVILASGIQLEGLVADINHPGRMTGWDVAHLARTKLPHIAVVYTTGRGELDWATQGVPGSTLVSKPYAPSQVVTALSSQLNTTG